MSLEQTKPSEPKKARGRTIPDTEIVWPSLAYQEHCSSYTNRLSELVFGSLLASYILGFFASGMSLVGGLAVWKSYAELYSSLKLFQILQYLFISVTFSYLTAAYYVTYHNSILTMPQIPPHKLKTDFGLALVQAVLFGFSMIRPEGFFLFVGISLALVFRRQQEVFKQLSQLFHRIKGTTPRGQVDAKSEEKFFENTLIELNSNPSYSKCLRGWLPVSLSMKLSAVFLIVLGGFSELRHYFEWGRNYLHQNSLPLAAIQTALYFFFFVLLWYITDEVFEKGAKHPLAKKDTSSSANDDNSQTILAIDEAAEAIVMKLRGDTVK